MAKTLAAAVLAAMLFAAPLAGDAQSQPAGLVPVAIPQSAPSLVIGSGDLISVSIIDAPELSGHFRVDQKGDVDMPLLGSVQVSGLTAGQAARLIEKQYVQAQILVPEESRSTVFIEEYANQGITVSGEVKSPGVYPAFGVRTLNDVLTAAGGATLAAASKVIVTRHSDPQHPVTVDYNPEVLPRVTPEVQILPGDKIFVPRAGIVYVLGAVAKAGGFVLDGHEVLTAEKAMALAGGQGRAAALKRTQLVRSLQGGRKVMIAVPLDRIFKGKAPDVALQDGDILYVPTSAGKLATTQAITSVIGIGSAVAIYKTAY